MLAQTTFSDLYMNWECNSYFSWTLFFFKEFKKADRCFKKSSTGGQCCSLGTRCSNYRGGKLCERPFRFNCCACSFFYDCSCVTLERQRTDEGEGFVGHWDYNRSPRQISFFERPLQSRVKTMILIFMNSIFDGGLLTLYFLWPLPFPLDKPTEYHCGECFISSPRGVNWVDTFEWLIRLHYEHLRLKSKWGKREWEGVIN